MSKDATSLTFADPEIRTSSIEELATITGWDPKTIRRAARAGALADKGVLHIPSETGGPGTFMVALKPFLTWFRGEAIAKPFQTPGETAQAVKMLHTLATVRDLLTDVA